MGFFKNINNNRSTILIYMMMEYFPQYKEWNLYMHDKVFDDVMFMLINTKRVDSREIQHIEIPDCKSRYKCIYSSVSIGEAERWNADTAIYTDSYGRYNFIEKTFYCFGQKKNFKDSKAMRYFNGVKDLLIHLEIPFAIKGNRNNKTLRIEVI